MDRNDIMWILEYCVFSLDGVPKKQIIKYGCPKHLADMGMQLCDYLKNKEIVEELKNGY